MSAQPKVNQREQVATAVLVAWVIGATLVAMVLQLPGRRWFPETWYPAVWVLPVAGIALGFIAGLLHALVVMFARPSVVCSFSLAIGIGCIGSVAGLMAGLARAGVPWQSQPSQFYLVSFVTVTGSILALLITRVIISRQLAPNEI